MAFVLFVIYIPKGETKSTPSRIEADERDETTERSNVEREDDVGVGVAEAPSPLSETSFKTAEECAKTPDTEDEIKPGSDALLDTSVNVPDSAAESVQGEGTAEGQDRENETAENEDVEVFYEAKSFEEKLKEELKSLNIQNDAWNVTDDGKSIQVSFVERSGERCEGIINTISKNTGIGTVPDTTISVFPTSVHLQYEPDSDSEENSPEGEGNEIPVEEKEHEFKKSIKSRLVVAQISNISTFIDISYKYPWQALDILMEMEESEVNKKFVSVMIYIAILVMILCGAICFHTCNNISKDMTSKHKVVAAVEANAELTFDYVMLIFLASWIAALGLGENSSVVLVASMLISPLMGPILAFVFGTVVKKNELRNLGLKSELIGLGICLGFGLLAGFIYAGLGVQGKLLGNSDSWPTSEMSSRGIHRSLMVGVLIAIPSGAGVALSILGGNAGSLVGVAISASLLPPAVNAGMLWALSITAAISPPELEESSQTPLITAGNNTDSSLSTITATNTTSGPLPVVPTSQPVVCAHFVNNAYTPTYSCDLATEAAILGSLSLILTILNIFCILVVGMLVLKLKEVAPHTSPSSSTEDFFRKDLKVARASYQTAKGEKSRELAKKFLEEYNKIMPKIEEKDEDKETKKNKRTLYFKTVLEEVENSNDVKKVLGSLPATKSPVTPFYFELQEDFVHAQKNIFFQEQQNFRNMMKAPVNMGSHAKVYRTIHACDLPTAAQPSSPTPTSPVTGGKYPFKKHKSEYFVVSGGVSGRPKSMHDSSTPNYNKANKTSGKKGNLKLKIEPQIVEFKKEEEEEETTSKKDGKGREGQFKAVTITDGEDDPLLPAEEPRFVVETVDEKEIKGEKQTEKPASAENEMTGLLSDQK